MSEAPANSPSPARGSTALVLLGVLVVLVCALVPRLVLNGRTPDLEGAGWTTPDPDSLYHARRVERLLDEGEVAGSDAFLNHPEGARIPWPPYYDHFVGALLAPFVPEGSARHGFIERGVASLPMVFGVLTALIAFLAGRALAGNAAGVAAGILQALTTVTITYSCHGNGDHHAFIAMLSGAVFTISSIYLRGSREGGERRSWFRRPWVMGSLAGLLTGIGIGAWVATLMHVVLIDAIFALLLLGHARKPRPGLAAFGLAFHAVALVVLVPAVLQSPWKEEFPWMAVNLSWFHLTYLGTGALIFLPLVFASTGGAFRFEGRVFRLYPVCVGLVLTLVIAGLTLLDSGPIAGIREGFAWVSRSDEFMSSVAESRPLIGSNARPGELFLMLGWGIALLPLAWLGGLVRLIRRGESELLPWIVATPVFAIQAAGQARFADVLAVPAAVLLAWAGARLIARWPRGRPAMFATFALLCAAFVAQGATMVRIVETYDVPHATWRRRRAARELCEWIAAQPMTPSPGRSTPRAVLANWSRGHEIEWAAQRPSVATNFGSYVGVEGFLAPAHFFLNADPARAEAVLEARDAQYVLVSSFLPGALPGWVRAGDAEWEGRFFHYDEEGERVLHPAFFQSIGGYLVAGGRPLTRGGAAPRDSLDFLRLVHVSPMSLDKSLLSRWLGVMPYGTVWESVPGARLEFRGEPGALVAVRVLLEFPADPKREPAKISFVRHAICNANGLARVRVPYATVSANGDGRVLSASWELGGGKGKLRIEERDVIEGRTIALP